MSIKHTPGPWEAREHSDGSHWFVDWEQGGEGYTLVDGLSEADARLIAAAPDLLQKLKALVNMLSDDKDDYPDSSYFRMIQDAEKEALALIAKAEGKV